MDTSSKIETCRLRIIPFSSRHLTTTYVSWLNDPEIVRYSEQRHQHHTLESCQKYWQSFIGTPHFLWAIEKKEGLAHIGNINAYVDVPNRRADIGILIGEKTQHGHHFGLEAFLGVSDFLFFKQEIRKVTAGTMATNEPMVKLMHRLGMNEDGIRRRQCLWNGGDVDVIHMSLFQKNWPDLRLNFSTYIFP